MIPGFLDERGNPFGCCDQSSPLPGFKSGIDLRKPDKPARQNSCDALNIPRRPQLAAEALEAYTDSPLIGPALDELANATIGQGMRLKPMVDWESVGGDVSEDEKTKFEDDQKRLYKMASTSKRNWIDQCGQQNLNQMSHTMLKNVIVQGEVYTGVYQFTDDRRPFRTSVAVWEPARIRTPDDLPESERENVLAGHVVGPTNRTSAYYVHDYHRNDPRIKADKKQYQRVRRYNEFGREQVIHTYSKLMPGQTRGLTALTACLSELKCFEKYSQVRMEAAIIQTAMAFVIRSSDKNVLNDTFASSSGIENNKYDPSKDPQWQKTVAQSAMSQEYLNAAGIKLDGAKALRLVGDEKAEILTGSEASVNDEQFVKERFMSIARCLGHSRATLTQDFEASYSAARAAMLSFYRQCEHLGGIVSDWLERIFCVLMEDWILSGQLKVPNYPDPTDAWMHFVLNRDAYSSATFRGPKRDEIDTAKTAQGAKIEQDIGAFCFEEYFDKHKGQDWKDAFKQQFAELKEFNRLFMEAGYPGMTAAQALAWLRPKWSLLASAEESSEAKEIINSNE